MIYKLALLALCAVSTFAQTIDDSFTRTVQLTTAAEIAGGTPLQVPSTGSGVATIEYTVVGLQRSISWDITFQGLSSPATLAHFHGPADATMTAGVALTISNEPFQSPLSGSMVISAQQAQDLVNDMWYINIHTESNPMGEIRGQVLVQQDPNTEILIVQEATIDLTTEAEMLGGTALATPSNGVGTATVRVTTEAPYVVSWGMSFSDLTGNPTAAHFHGPATQLDTAGVQVVMEGALFTSPSSGLTEITRQQAEQLMNGQWYINVHTPSNPMGEIRGQVQNFQTVELRVASNASMLSATVAIVLSVVAYLAF